MNRRQALAAGSAAVFVAGASPISLATTLPRTLFQSPAGERMALGKFPEFGPSDFLFDYGHQRAGQMQASRGPRHAVLSTLVGPGEPIAHIEMQGASLNLSGSVYEPVSIIRHTFSVRIGDIVLFAEVARRGDSAPRGTLVMVHGSGPGPCEGFDLWAFHFLSRGWQVVTYDKRGSGRSGGDWLKANFEVLAADLRAVLRSVPNVVRPLGLWGISQAGWIMPQVSPLVDFIISHAGAGTTPGEQMVDAVEAELIAYKMAPTEIAKAVAYSRLDLDVTMGRADWATLQAAYQRAVSEKAEWLRGPPDPPNSPFRNFIRGIAAFRSEPFWRASNIPVLAIFGGKDVIVPASKNKPLLKSFQMHNTRYQELLLPQANHIGMIADTGVRREYPRCTNFEPAYFSSVDNWLAKLR